ncbi:MAG TPA: PKD domain-containing protein, partial [Alphaproteobacteria bacterium]|nr:PKD domain-containing protein [Alphaproteobacteria bacterium]
QAPTPGLSANCTATPRSGNSPLSVAFGSSVSGGSGVYSYTWTFGDGSTANTAQTATHTYNAAGTHSSSLTVTDGAGRTVITNCGQIVVSQPTPTPSLDIDSINCFPRIASGGNQSCSVYVTSSADPTPGGVDVDIYYVDGTFFGTCTTDPLSGGCEAQSVVTGTGQRTVYATAQLAGHINDTDTYPRYTFDVFAQRYNIINLGTYNDSNFMFPDDVFYRGEDLYARFQVYDPINNQFVTSDIVTAASLVSLPGGRADMSRMTYSGNWYYYELAQIPLTHDFLGDSNVFAFAFNFTGLTAGQAQVELTILNNEPVMNPIPDVYVTVGGTNILDLDSYGTDLEDNPLRYQITSPTSTGYTAAINANNNQLSITGAIVGDYTLTVAGYDLDNAFDTTNIIVHVIPATNNTLTTSCVATPTSGNAPLTVAFGSTTSGGTGSYTYRWTFGDNTNSTTTTSTTSHTYNNAGSYTASLTVTDGAGNTATANCGPSAITVNPVTPALTAACSANPTNGNAPLAVTFNATGTGGSGAYTYTYNYDSTSSFTTTDSTSIFTYNNAGTYNPTLTITDAAGNTATADCGTDITVTNPTPVNLSVSCLASPSSGNAPLNVTFVIGASGGSGVYTYTYNYDSTSSFTTNSSTSIFTYNTVGTYTPDVDVVDSLGNSGSTTCGLIVISNAPPANVTLIADAGGPYTGFLNEPITFNASGSQSSLGIVSYRWDFGDGTVVTTTSPTLNHTYRSIGWFVVTLTVTDAGGYQDSDTTTAFIVERTNFAPRVFEDLPDKGLSIMSLQVYGRKGEILMSNDEMTVSMLLKNHWNRRLENVRVHVSIPEFGLEARSQSFDISKGGSESETVILPLEDIPPGAYYVKIYVTNDDDGEQVKRTKYREIIVK